MKVKVDLEVSTVNQYLLKVCNLKKHYIVRDSLFSRPKVLPAVDDVSFQVGYKETLGIVGESGCGKSTLARCMMGLEPSTSGQIYFDGVELTTAKAEQLRQLRRNYQIVFQDPYSSLDPYHTIGDSIVEPLVNYHLGTNQEQQERLNQLLTVVGLKPEYKNRYPHEFSGGQLQRVNIARALTVNPAMVVCDEAVSNLDGIVKGQIVDLLLQLKEKFHMSYVFITHDLTLVRRIADRVAVMLGGKLVEVLPAMELDQAIHPYTRYLLSSSLSGDPRRRRSRQRSIQFTESESGMGSVVTGCVLQYRCPGFCQLCCQEEPLLKNIGPIHQVACHLIG